jgi:hypothetical protein
MKNITINVKNSKTGLTSQRLRIKPTEVLHYVFEQLFYQIRTRFIHYVFAKSLQHLKSLYFSRFNNKKI